VIFYVIFGAGCATVDILPNDIPKGYVEFYAYKGETFGQQIPIVQGTYMLDEEEKRICDRNSILQRPAHPVNRPDICMWCSVALWTGGTRCKIAKSPGSHTFNFLNNEGISVTVEVKEKMITPVRITVTGVAQMYASPETPIPFQ
jgi:hypothetical protein